MQYLDDAGDDNAGASYSSVMRTQCAKIGMKPVCDHRSYCFVDSAQSVFIGQTHHLGFPRHRHDSRYMPDGFAAIAKHWDGLCSYCNNQQSGKALCNIPINTHSWRTPQQASPGFMCGCVSKADYATMVNCPSLPEAEPEPEPVPPPLPVQRTMRTVVTLPMAIRVEVFFASIKARLEKTLEQSALNQAVDRCNSNTVNRSNDNHSGGACKVECTKALWPRRSCDNSSGSNYLKGSAPQSAVLSDVIPGLYLYETCTATGLVCKPEAESLDSITLEQYRQVCAFQTLLAQHFNLICIATAAVLNLICVRCAYAQQEATASVSLPLPAVLPNTDTLRAAIATEAGTSVGAVRLFNRGRRKLQGSSINNSLTFGFSITVTNPKLSNQLASTLTAADTFAKSLGSNLHAAGVITDAKLLVISEPAFKTAMTVVIGLSVPPGQLLTLSALPQSHIGYSLVHIRLA